MQGPEVEKPVVTIEEHVKDKNMLRSKARNINHIKLGDYVMYYRDIQKWVGPAKVVKIYGPLLYLIHNEQTVTASFNRSCLTNYPDDSTHAELEEIHTIVKSHSKGLNLRSDRKYSSQQSD